MSFRFWRRIRLAPGVTLNLSKSTASLSFGPPGARYTISPRGNRRTLGIPGTGLFYTVQEPRRAGLSKAPARPARDRLDPGLFQRLFTPADERALVDGLKALDAGEEKEALLAFERAEGLPDAAWLAGMLRLKREEFGTAREHLEIALSGLDRLGGLLEKYGIDARIGFPVTPEIDAHVLPRERGTRLALVEIAQIVGRHEDAWHHIERLMLIDPTDPVVPLSFAELALDTPGNRDLMDRVVISTARVENETMVETAIPLYRGRALAALDMTDAAIDVLTSANRRRKGRPEALMRQIRYDRAVYYDLAGREAQARREFERLYAEDPGFEDVRERLGFTD